MEPAAARALVRAALANDAFWRVAGSPPEGWQLAVEDWRPGRGLCGRCGRGAGLLAVVVHPGGAVVERLGVDCLERAGLPAPLSAAAARGLRAARVAANELDAGPETGDTELAAWHPGIALALEHGLGAPRAWRQVAIALRARAAMVLSGVEEADAPSLEAITGWSDIAAAIPVHLEAHRKLADLMARLLDGTATDRQASAAAKLLATPWEDYNEAWPPSWGSWGAWPAQVRRWRWARRRDR